MPPPWVTLSLPTQDQVLPLMNLICMSLSRVLARMACGKASSMRFLPVCGLTLSHIARRAMPNSGSMCQ
jgi:hypothetical protein